LLFREYIASLGNFLLQHSKIFSFSERGKLFLINKCYCIAHFIVILFFWPFLAVMQACGNYKNKAYLSLKGDMNKTILNKIIEQNILSGTIHLFIVVGATEIAPILGDDGVVTHHLHMGPLEPSILLTRNLAPNGWKQLKQCRDMQSNQPRLYLRNAEDNYRKQHITDSLVYLNFKFSDEQSFDLGNKVENLEGLIKEKDTAILSLKTNIREIFNSIRAAAEEAKYASKDAP
ncbi:hypothetical protein ACJX0J_020119, partial [Zea mays]